MQTYYKVVAVKGLNHYVSAIHNDHPQLTVQYKVGEWAKPNISGTRLMCFNSFDSAKTFVLCNGSMAPKIIFKCAIKRPRKTGIFCAFANLDSDCVFTHILNALRLKSKQRKYIRHRSFELLKGMVFCDEIMLIEEAW